MSIQDVARLKDVTSAAISPDGTHVAYILSVPRRPMKDDNGPAWGELHVVDVEGNSRPFITGEVNIGGVDWTPDGKGISFVAKRDGDEKRSLYIIPIDGGEARRLIKHDENVGDYSWSPDGKQVAFLATEKEDKEKKKLEDKGFNPDIYEEDFRTVRVWIAKADFDSEDKPRMLDLPGSATQVHWSPDGANLALALSPTPLIDDVYMQSRVHVVNIESGEVTARVANPGKLGAIRWSTDGQRLAFLSGEDIHDPSEGRVMVASAATGEFKQILQDFLPDTSALAWQDAQTLMFVSDDGCWTVFGEVAFDGTRHQTHIPPGGPILGGLTLSRDGMAAAFVGSTPEHPGEVFLSSHADKGPRRLTHSNPWLAQKRFAKQEVVKYKARDGETIEGVLTHPLDAEPGTRHPLIVYVHGGPESRVANGWVTRYSMPGQVGAAQGYAILHPNYRGSTGRGVAFAKAHQADYAGKEFDDLVDGVDHLIELGLVDKDKVGVTGGSYGGFASAWCATYYTERFAAAVMFVGISDHISKAGTTDIPEEMFLVHARKRPWDDWQFFLDRSPIKYVEQARTPILIMHGKEDTRVHPSQSLELYRNLKILDQTPVRLVLYPGEGHGNRKAASRYDYSMRLMRWMNHYLKGPGGDPPPYEIEYGLEPEKDEDATATEPEAKPET